MDHYAKSRMESIEIMRNSMSDSEFRGFLLGNIYKYINRYQHKGTPVTDLSKAANYIQALIVFESDPECKNPFAVVRERFGNGK